MADRRTSREVRALRSLHDLITTVHSLQDLEEVLQTTAQGVVEVLGFEVAVIDVVDAYGFVEAKAVAGDEDACRAMRNRRAPVREILDEFEIADAWGSLRFVPHDRLPPDAVTSWAPDVEPLDLPDAWHPLDALYAPLHGPTGQLLGVLSVDLPVDRRRPGALGRQVLEMYAVQAGLAIHHAQERQRLRERIRLAAATRLVVETASRELDLASVVDRCFQPLVEGFGCDRLLIRVFDAVQQDLDGGPDALDLSGVGATYPPGLMDQLRPKLAEVTADLVDPARYLVIGERVARACWPQGRTMLVADLRDTTAGLLDEREVVVVRGLLTSLDAASLLVVPLGAGPTCLGYLTMIRADPEATWTEAEDEAALEVGREIGRAVDRARLYQRERRLVGELLELDDYKREMISTLTHELKNPLTSIRGHVELLDEQGVSPRSVGAIARNVGRISVLVDDLLVLAKVSDPHRPLVADAVRLAVLVEEVCDSLAVEISRAHLALDLSGVDPTVEAWGERDEISRILGNIVGNAVKYTPEGGTVALRTHTESAGGTGGSGNGPAAVFTCTDSGIGIRAEDIGGLFEEFDRSSNPVAHQHPGSGLGLAIVRRIVERHRGQVEVTSEVGAGSTFRVVLPGVAAQSSPGPSPDQSSAPSAVPSEAARP